jgi:tRNA(fMet)-specific endonuclease VapC
MAVFIADTDVLIDFLRGAGEAERIGIELNTGRLCVTAITAFELWAGAKNPQQAAMVESLLNATTILSVDPSSVKRAADVYRKLLEDGMTIGMADSLIAGIALDRDAILITRNRKHYQRVPGLRLSDQYYPNPS